MNTYKQLEKLAAKQGITINALLNKHNIQEIEEYDLEQQYDEMLDDCYPDLKIAGYSYCTSRALKDIDPIAYNCGYSDYISSLIEETIIECDGQCYWDLDDVNDLIDQLNDGEEQS